MIRIAIPPYSRTKKELVKQAKNTAENARVSIRNTRRDGNDDFKKQQKEGLISEDVLKTLENALQKETDEFILEINKILEEKEKEILEG